VKNSIPFLYMEEEDAKAGTRGIWSCSAVFWNARLFMTGIQPVSRDRSGRYVYAHER